MDESSHLSPRAWTGLPYLVKLKQPVLFRARFGVRTHVYTPLPMAIRSTVLYTLHVTISHVRSPGFPIRAPPSHIANSCDIARIEGRNVGGCLGGGTVTSAARTSLTAWRSRTAPAKRDAAGLHYSRPRLFLSPPIISTRSGVLSPTGGPYLPFEFVGHKRQELDLPSSSDTTRASAVLP